MAGERAISTHCMNYETITFGRSRRRKKKEASIAAPSHRPTLHATLAPSLPSLSLLPFPKRRTEGRAGGQPRRRGCKGGLWLEGAIATAAREDAEDADYGMGARLVFGLLPPSAVLP